MVKRVHFLLYDPKGMKKPHKETSLPEEESTSITAQVDPISKYQPLRFHLTGSKLSGSLNIS